MTETRNQPKGDRVRVISPLIAVALVLPVSAACTSHTAPHIFPAEPQPSTSALATPSIAPADVLKARVDGALAAYRGLWAAYISATRHPDPDDPGIRKWATGDALNVFVSGLASMKSQRLAGSGTVELHPTTVAIEPAAAPTTVGVSDCVNSAGSHLYKVDGSAYQDTKGGKRRVNATAQFRDGVWKVTEFAEQKVGSC